MGLTNTTVHADFRHAEPGAARVQLRTRTRRSRSRRSHVLRGSDVLEHRTGGRRSGANQTTNIDDMIKTAVAVGTGAAHVEVQLRSHDRPAPARLRAKQDNCAPCCFTQMTGLQLRAGRRALGIVDPAEPAADGYSATEAYLPSKKIAIAVATTFAPGSVRLAGELREFQRHIVPIDRRVHGAGRRAACTEAEIYPGAPSVADPSVQSAIVAAVENDRKRFGGHTPVPATLIGVWDAKGNSFIRAFGDADLEKKVPSLRPTTSGSAAIPRHSSLASFSSW